MVTEASVKDRDISVEIVRHPGIRSGGTWQDAQQPVCPEVVPRGFVVQAMRWVVERNHAWNERARRLLAQHNRSNGAPRRLGRARVSAYARSPTGPVDHFVYTLQVICYPVRGPPYPAIAATRVSFLFEPNRSECA